MAGKILGKPDGPHEVGSVTQILIDDERSLTLTENTSGRRLFLKVWYPAGHTAADTYRRENLWEQLSADPSTPVVVKLLLKFITRTKTNTFHQAHLAPEISGLEILLYNHGMISFASENTVLMEYLASHGYIVIAVQHLDQLIEFKTLQSQQSAERRQEQAKLQKQLQQSTGTERAALSREYYLAAANTNRIVSARAGDCAYIVNRLHEILNQVPEMDIGRVHTDHVGLIGLSLGGAVGTEFSKIDDRVRFDVNLDGGMYGLHREEPITVPYLMLYSQDNDGCNELFFKNSEKKVIQETLPDTRHLNFHDIAMLLPFLRWFRITGKADPVATVDARNKYVYEFIRSV